MSGHAGISRTGALIGAVVIAALAGSSVMILRLDWTGRSGSGLGGEFAYDIARLRKIDPKLILYEQSGAIATGFRQARGVAAGPEDRIYVVGDEAVRIFDRSGQALRDIPLTRPARALAADERARLYICMKDHVEVYGATGQAEAKWDPLGKDAVLTSVAVSRNDVFVADAGNRVVLRYDTSGKLLGRIGQKDPDRNIPGFVIPSPYFDLAMGPDGLLRVVNPGRHRIEAYTRDGDLEFTWGGFGTAIEGFSGCCNPVNFAIVPGGGFVTCEKGLTRVKTYDGDGKFVGVVARPGQFAEEEQACTGEGGAECSSGGLDVAVDSRGRVLVLDPLSREVRIFTRIGRPAGGGGR